MNAKEANKSIDILRSQIMVDCMKKSSPTVIFAKGEQKCPSLHSRSISHSGGT